jgi:uncharacterized protein YbaP (TraB family)
MWILHGINGLLRRKTALVALAAALVLVARPALSEEPLRHGQGLLWQIEGTEAAPSYLFGTMHSTDPEIATPPAQVAERLDQAHSLTVEVIMNMETAMIVARAMVLTDGRTLDGILDPGLFEQVTEVGAGYGLRPQQLKMFKPWALMAMFSLPPAEMARAAQGGKALDEVLQIEAKARGTAVHGLESVDEQIAVLQSPSESDQVALLREVVVGYSELEPLFARMRGAYLDRDLATLYRLTQEQVAASDTQLMDSFLYNLIDRRNRLMVERMATRLAEGNAFIAVGALHLPGDQGILHLLEQQGYKVRPLY